ncbi:uncharacterized [Tachysurus ichikawai]
MFLCSKSQQCHGKTQLPLQHEGKTQLPLQHEGKTQLPLQHEGLEHVTAAVCGGITARASCQALLRLSDEIIRSKQMCFSNVIKHMIKSTLIVKVISLGLDVEMRLRMAGSSCRRTCHASKGHTESDGVSRLLYHLTLF